MTKLKAVRQEMIKLAAIKGHLNITNQDIADIEKKGYTFREVTQALKWLTYSAQAAKYRA